MALGSCHKIHPALRRWARFAVTDSTLLFVFYTPNMANKLARIILNGTLSLNAGGVYFGNVYGTITEN